MTDKLKRYPTKVEELPSGEFFAILYPESVTIPGDERSRTNPGHGYPEHTVEYWRMEVFSTRDLWEKEIKALEAATGWMKKRYKAIRAIPARVTVSVDVAISEASDG